MAPQRGQIIAKYLLAFELAALFACHAGAQAILEEPALSFSQVDTLGLPPLEASHLEQALKNRDYIAVEKLLLPEIEHEQRTKHAARLLAFAGGIYFLDHDYLNAAIAWKKSDAITPLPPQLKFSLSMTYIRIGHPDWAREVLESLFKQNQKEALYPYWLGRLDYDSHSYSQAIQYFKKTIALSPSMARAYDNLALCYFYQNQNALAIENYHKAIDLDRSSLHPSAWPYLNLAIALEFTNHISEAEVNLRKAIQIDPGIASAHFELGNLLEGKGETEAAISEFREAAGLDPDYAEPHFALARIYRKLGQESTAKKEVQAYLRIHGRSNTGNSSTDRSFH